MKSLKDYPELIQNLVKELKKNYTIGEFYSQRFYETSETEIAETILKVLQPKTVKEVR